MNGIFKTCTYRKQLLSLCCALLSFLISTAQNPIITENALVGNLPTEWDVVGAGDLTIQGFATDISVNKGQTIVFKINTDASAYTINIYRLGYYNGRGARLQGTGVVTATLPQVQPTPIQNSLGLVDCGNWAESAHWDVPSSAVSGIYIAKLTRTDNGGSSHIIFIVRDDASTSDLFFQTSDATWQAYNAYGGNSLYVGTTSFPGGHAAKVSYNRPFVTRAGGGGGGPGEDWVFNAEFPMLRFLERNGYDVTYTTNIDAARAGNLILQHKVFLSVGHDEYWSAEQRTAVENARNAGVHMAFFSGNEVYWKTRWEKSADATGAEDPTGTDFRTLVCYKEGTVGENVCGSKCDATSSVWTGLWRSGAAFDGGKPENALSGQISWDGSTTSMKVPGHFKNLRFWRNTAVASIGAEDELTLPMGTLGYEWDWEQFPDSYPKGRILLSSTTFNGKTHKLSLYRHTSGALVFGAGTVQWSWGLDDTHDDGNLPADPSMQQATVNLFADMGVQPGNLQAGLQPASISTDFTAPQTSIISPVHGSTVTSGSSITITGSASDVGGAVAGVEVSVDGGATWKVANGTNSWSYTWIPGVAGTAVIRVRGFDDSGNMEAIGTVPSANAISINVEAAVCPCTVFETTNSPELTNQFDNISGIEVGVKFKSNITGYITGMRFYKSTNDIGVHTASIWALNGNLLTQGVFVNETPEGWQQIVFASPVPVTAGVVYVASYHSPSGYYSETPSYFVGNEVTTGPLTAIALEDTDGPNGVYLYTTTPDFPITASTGSNYWVDVVFNTVTTPDVTPPTIISVFPANLATQVSTTVTLKANFNEFLDGNSVNASNFELRGPGNVLVPATVTLTPAQVVITLGPSSTLTYASVYTATLKGGPTGIRDIHGNAMTSDYSWTFTTGDPPAIAPTEGHGGPILVVSSTSNKFSRYPVEILRAEGLNQFTAKDISVVDATELNNYDVVILGEMNINAAQATLFSDWVNAGGTLIAFKPSTELSALLGITKVAGTLSDQYLLIKNDNGGVGTGIVGQTIQFHGSADFYDLNGATSIATLYSNATTATTHPAITSMNVGSNGGKAIAFTYDLAKSIVYTRQGNPAVAGQKRDGTTGPIRSDDMFFANPTADWIDMNKIAIPQADEQQRLLTNIIIKGNLHRKPLPRFWFLPRTLKAAVVMTGDDHAYNGTLGRFNQYLTLGPNSAQDLLDWKSVRGTSYMFTYTPLSNTQAASFEASGFELALHTNTGCDNFTPLSYETDLTTQLEELANAFPGISAPVTNRNHCIAWSDWATAAKIEYQHGIRLDANYYYWPSAFVQNRPGMFTGSGMPMRFADTDGSLIDVYQLATQMTDESGIDYASFSAALMDKAIGSEGYYGVFCANMHTDTANHNGSNLIIANAQARNIPVISAKQMLTWLDGRNDSYFTGMTWTGGNQLNFSIVARTGAYDLSSMLPVYTENSQLSALTRDGNPVSFTTEIIKGISYAFFPALNGDYVASYVPLTTGTLNGSVTLQGRPAAPHVRWEVPVKVELYASGNTTTPAFTYNVTTDQSGNFTVTDIPVGTYSIVVKNANTLRRVKSNYVISLGTNTINFGILLAGDVNDNNLITLPDLSILLSTFNKALGNPAYDGRADLNGDNIVSLPDLSLLISNFNKAGETP